MIAQVETAEAIERADEILATAGVAVAASGTLFVLSAS